MTRGVRLYLVGSFVLVSLAGCGRGFFQSEEREPWRAEAEIACLKSGAVKENADLVRIDPISGPGVCGAEFPLKVAALGEGSSSFGFADDDLRPPAVIGNQPRWPMSQPPPPQIAPYSGSTINQQPAYRGPSGPVSLTAPGVAPQKTRSICRPTASPGNRRHGLIRIPSPIRARNLTRLRSLIRTRKAIRSSSLIRRVLMRRPWPRRRTTCRGSGPARAIRSRLSGRSRSSRWRRSPVRSSRCSITGLRKRCSPPRCAGSAPASSRSSRSLPIPAAA